MHLHPLPISILLPACAADGEQCYRDGRLHLRVDWTPERLADWDAAALRTPAVHPSASPEAMQPTLDIIRVGGGWGAGRHCFGCQ